jgi:hypothetical protein
VRSSPIAGYTINMFEFEFPTGTIIFCAAWRAFTNTAVRQSTRRCGSFTPIERDVKFAPAYSTAAWCYGWRKLNS